MRIRNDFLTSVTWQADGRTQIQTMTENGTESCGQIRVIWFDQCLEWKFFHPNMIKIEYRLRSSVKEQKSVIIGNDLV